MYVLDVVICTHAPRTLTLHVVCTGPGPSVGAVFTVLYLEVPCVILIPYTETAQHWCR